MHALCIGLIELNSVSTTSYTAKKLKKLQLATKVARMAYYIQQMNESRIAYLFLQTAGLFLGYSSHACSTISCCDDVIYTSSIVKIYVPPPTPIKDPGYVNVLSW